MFRSSIEALCRHGPVHPRQNRYLAEALLVGAVPDADNAVAAAGGEGAVFRVEGEGVDGVHRGHLGLGRPVALERVLLLLGRLIKVPSQCTW